MTGDNLSIFNIFKKRTPKRPAIVDPGFLSAPEAGRHAVHALAGLMMDRHDECKSHWWCGTKRGQIIIMIVSIKEHAEDGIYFATAYLNQARYTGDDSKPPSPEDVARLDFVGDGPLRKLVIQPTTAGNLWAVTGGPVKDHTPGDHSSGLVDKSHPNSFQVYADDRPPWAKTPFKLVYDDNNYQFDERHEPRFHIIERYDGWNVYLVDIRPPHATKRNDGRDVHLPGMRPVASFPRPNNPYHLSPSRPSVMVMAP